METSSTQRENFIFQKKSSGNNHTKLSDYFGSSRHYSNGNF